MITTLDPEVRHHNVRTCNECKQKCKGYLVLVQTCFQPLSMMTCISLIVQNAPGSVSPVLSIHMPMICRTFSSLSQVQVNSLLSLFSQVATEIWKGDMIASGECIASYAEPLYPTITLGFNRTGLDVDKGLSAWIKQHSEASRCDAAKESLKPRKRSGLAETKGVMGMATGDC
jgi:hypothetical protein